MGWDGMGWDDTVLYGDVAERGERLCGQCSPVCQEELIHGSHAKWGHLAALALLPFAPEPEP